MSGFVRCDHLRDRDYFDPDYDLTFNDLDQHKCLYYKRDVIPHDECGPTCDGYTPLREEQIARIHQLNARSRLQRSPHGQHRPASSAATAGAKVSREALLTEVEKIVTLVTERMPSQTQINDARARLDEATAVYESQLKSQPTNVERRVAELQQDLKAKRRRMEVALVITQRVYQGLYQDTFPRPASDPLAASLFGSPVGSTGFEDMPLAQFIGTYTGWLGVSLTRNPDIRELRQIQEEIERVKTLPPDTTFPGISAYTDDSHLVAVRRTLEDLERRHDVLGTLHEMLSEQVKAAIARGPDPLQEWVVAAIRRFLEEARAVTSVPGSEAERLLARLKNLPLP
ncbi:MAG TPA: hypothetical protein VF808_10410 [Ktedonobacterales bacterium]